MAKWHYQQHDGYGDIDQSSSAEAFEGAAVKGLSTSVVRESVQNVLDVSLNTSEPARVRFTLIESSTNDSVCNDWFEGLMHHLQQPDAGAPEAPKPEEPCRSLLIEDFDTSGLVGDYAAPYVPGTENNFVNFLYHDGLTGKGVKKLGSRGVGKIVLLLASRARTIFAYTIRTNDPVRHPLLVGKSLLKFRQVDDKLYKPASYFVESWPEGGAREPVEDKADLNRFRDSFALSRVDETGLSVVIPYLDPSITLEELRRAIIEEYHFAILNGKLVVELADGSSVEKIDADHIPDLDDEELSARVALAQFAIDNPNPELQTIAPPAGDLQKLSEIVVPEDVRGAILDALNQHERIAIRCNLHIHPKGTEAVETWCDLYFETVEKVHQRPIFVRELLPISGEGKPCSQLRALVLIRPGPLADLLRAAEGANHTQWSPRTDNFKKAYKGRLGEIEFVSSCVNRLIEIARGNATEPVGGISTFFFSAPLDDEGGKSKNKGKKKPGPQPDTPDIPVDPPTPIGYLFNQEPSGFTLRGDPEKLVPKRITVRVAYDILRGSPWSDYDPDDFDLRKPKGEVQVVCTDTEIQRSDPGNKLVIVPSSKSFKVVVTGFNEQLDLIVDHRMSDTPRKRKGERDAGQTD
ncbi:hypothetical protein OAK91_04490 [Planctomycetaceae bacterium]|nr:hypothetical protein [Planctomycetaceae bacterium]